MSILDNAMGGLTGKGGGGGLMQLAGQLIKRGGGVQGLKQLLSKSGLGEQVSSWIGKGENQPVSGQQLGHALQQGGVDDTVNDAAQKMGTSTDQVHDQLAKVMPQVVDHLTPDGQPPADDGSGMDLSALSGLAGKLFG
jgi:uncharacterized protein YidB (DUF937 family)